MALKSKESRLEIVFQELPAEEQSYLRARMENWNQDLPERCSKFRGLYIKFQGHGKWPWTW